MSPNTERRILVVDDDASVREAYRKILARPQNDGLADARAGLFDDEPVPPAARGFSVECVEQGQLAIDRVAAGIARGESFAMAFVDMRMPPGMDGLATAKGLWKHDPDLQIVLATAYSDCSWERVLAELGSTDRLLILKKPFDPVEAQQLAEALVRKRTLLDEVRKREVDMEARILTRTRELSEALVAAEAATRAKSEFLANMSHEIRTPMAAILGFADLLCGPELTREQHDEHVEIIRRNGGHLLSILNDILDLSKIEAGQMLVERVPSDPGAILAGVASLLRVRASVKELNLELVYEGTVPERIQTDPTRFRQIVMNLVGNAIKFTEKGGVTLRVSMLDPESDAPRLRVAIEDTGIGIPAEKRNQLFRAFAQSDATTTRRFGGTGLGLAISKQLARLLGGDVDVESTEGKGSTFTVTIPTGSLEDVRRVTGAVETVAAQPSADAPKARISARILLAEDGHDNQRLVTLILTRAGADVVTADNGQIALDQVERSEAEGRPFDLILMDMQMPVMDGHEATRQLRARGWTGPIVALTAHAMAGDKEHCFRDGCNSYETKPVRGDRLVATCLTLLAPSIVAGQLLPTDAPSSRA